MVFRAPKIGKAPRATPFPHQGEKMQATIRTVKQLLLVPPSKAAMMRMKNFFPQQLRPEAVDSRMPGT